MFIVRRLCRCLSASYRASFLVPASGLAMCPVPADAQEVSPVVSGRPESGRGDWGVFNAQDGMAAGWGVVTQYGQARWAEDWSWLRGRSRTGDWFDRLKFIPLDESGSVYLTLNAEERLRGFYESRPQLGTQPSNSNRMLLRSFWGADLHVGAHVRLYAELANGIAAGSRYYGYADGYQRQRLDLQQAFLEVKGKLLGAKAGVMIGRQLFLDSPPFALSVRDLPNIVQSWNGVRGYAVWSRVRLDMFDFLQTDLSPNAMFGNRPDWNTRLFGAYGSYALPAFRAIGGKGQLFFDLYYYGYLYRGAASQIAGAGGTLSGPTRRDNYGVRLWGDVGPLNVSLGGIFQGGHVRPDGEVGRRKVAAYSVNGSALYAFPRLFGKPALGVQADLFSGGDRNGRAVGTYAAPFFNVPFYNDITASLGPQNALVVGPRLEWKPLPKLAVKAHVPFSLRASRADGLYAVNRLYSFQPRSGRYVGVLPQVDFIYKVAPHLEWSNLFAGFKSSKTLRRAGAKDSFFYMQTWDFRF